MPETNRLGRYVIEARLGEGHYAVVYRALDTVLERHVALKVLKTTLGGDEEAFDRFLREAQVLATLVHPRIAWVWDLGEADARHYLSMRLVQGPNLAQFISQKGALPWKDALEICSQVADGLHFAHQKGMAHRDVKPQNILVSPEEGAVLTDFGLVKIFSENKMTNTHVALGTPHYMAPEVWRATGAGAPADQYALACVLYEMLTGKVLFTGDSTPAVMTQHILDFLN